MNTENIDTKFIFVILASLYFWGSVSLAAEPQVDRRVAAKIAKEKGLLKPKEILEWKTDPKDLPKDWIKLENKYFSVSYPKCFILQGEEGEEDPKLAPSVAFNRSENCPNFLKGYGDFNWLVISVSLIDFENVSLENNIFRQDVDLNGKQAIYFVGLMDYTEIKNEFQFKVRSRVFTKCSGKTFKLTFDLPPGSLSEKFIEKNKYDFPQDFKKIVSTFKCK